MRTGTVSYKLEDLKKGVIIPIGFVGENDFTRVIFDAEEIYKKFPNASVNMKVQPPKGGIYPATVARDGNTVIWQVKEADVANRGGGELQLTFTDGETKIKTYIARTDVKRSLEGNGPAPDPVQDWIDDAEEVLDDLEAMDTIAKNAQAGDIGKALSPKTVENGVVTEWQYVEPGGGTEDYTDLENKPSIAGVTLSGNKTLEDLGIAAADDLDNLTDEVSDVKTAIDGILDHETYQDGSGTEYDPVTASNTVASARFTINDHNVAFVSTPTTTSMNIYPVQQGKTYKVKGYCNGTLNRPLLIVADSAITSSIIAYENEYDSELGTAVETPAVDELEYIALRNGYLYINYSDSSCGVWLKKTVTQTKYHIDDVMEDVDGLREDVAQNESDITDILSNETYPGTGSAEYEAVAQDKSADSSRMTINSNDKVFVSTPTTTKLKTYPVIQGKKYKIKGYCDGSKNRPLLVVADASVVTGDIATAGNYDVFLGTATQSAAVQETEYVALRTGYLYINYLDSTCGVWVQIPTETVKYKINDALDDIDELTKAVYGSVIDSASAIVKSVPVNAKPVAKIKSMANSVTLIRSILGRNLANKDVVGNVVVDSSNTTQKGIKTVKLPAGRYYINLGSMANTTRFVILEKGIYSYAYYADQQPMIYNIVDPNGGYIIVYSDTVAHLGDMGSLIIARLKNGESSVNYEAYAEKSYTPEDIETNNEITVYPFGLIEFQNSGNADVASVVEFIITGKPDNTTTRKDFITSPDGTKFLPIIKNDGSVVGARVIPKKALFIGNSLTSGWQTFGESATEHTKDFIALFSDVVGDLDSDYTFSRIWATGFEQKTSLADAEAFTTTNIDPSLDSDLDLIVVQLSDNVTGSSQGAVFPDTSLWLLQHLRTECPKARVVWMGVWFDRGWVQTLLDNTANTGCEYVDIRPLYNVSSMAYIGMVYEMEADYTKTYEVDSFTVSNGQITLVFTVDGTQYTATIPSYTSYTSSSDTNISVTGVYHIANTYYASIHPGDEGFRKIANKLLFDLGISESEETIPADE